MNRNASHRSHLRLLGMAFLLMSTLACHTSKNSRSASAAPWFYWAIEFKPGVSKDQMIKVVEDMQMSINKSYPFATISYYTAQSKLPRIILLEARQTAGYSQPKAGPTGPKHPPYAKDYASFSTAIEKIVESPGEKYGSMR